jgi:hypothetical protein
MITLEWLLLQRMFYIQLVLNVIHIIIFALRLSFLLLLPHRLHLPHSEVHDFYKKRVDIFLRRPYKVLMRMKDFIWLGPLCAVFLDPCDCCPVGA